MGFFRATTHNCHLMIALGERNPKQIDPRFHKDPNYPPYPYHVLSCLNDLFLHWKTATMMERNNWARTLAAFWKGWKRYALLFLLIATILIRQILTLVASNTDLICLNNVRFKQIKAAPNIIFMADTVANLRLVKLIILGKLHWRKLWLQE